jgi:hypothetical protein
MIGKLLKEREITQEVDVKGSTLTIKIAMTAAVFVQRRRVDRPVVMAAPVLFPPIAAKEKPAD